MNRTVARKLAGVALASAISVSAANATVMNVTLSGPGKAAAEAAEALFLSYLKETTTETFEGFTAATGSGDQAPSILTSVGTFHQLIAGENDPGAACNDNGFSCTAGMAILNGVTSPFGGRFPMPDEADNTNWLDSMDSREVKLTLDGMYTAIGFYMTDPNDVGGIMDLVFEDQSTATFNMNNIFTGAQPDGASYYLGFTSDVAINSLIFRTNADNDGFGIDNLTVGRVPEPGTLVLLGLGLVGLGVMRRRAR